MFWSFRGIYFYGDQTEVQEILTSNKEDKKENIFLQS